MANIRGRFLRLCMFICPVTWDGWWFSVLQHQPVSFVILYSLIVTCWDLRDSIMLEVIISVCCLSVLVRGVLAVWNVSVFFLQLGMFHYHSRVYRMLYKKEHLKLQ